MSVAINLDYIANEVMPQARGFNAVSEHLW